MIAGARKCGSPDSDPVPGQGPGCHDVWRDRNQFRSPQNSEDPAQIQSLFPVASSWLRECKVIQTAAGRYQYTLSRQGVVLRLTTPTVLQVDDSESDASGSCRY